MSPNIFDIFRDISYLCYMKVCCKCNKEKTEEDFCFRNKSKNVRHGICKTCQNEYKKIYYYNNKESHYRRNEITKNKLKEYTNSKKVECLICKESEKICLDFHHLDPSKKDLEIGSLNNKGSLSRLKKEIEKCVVLCSNCHRKVHADIIKL